MSVEDRPKRPTPDVGAEEDWEKALNAWETGGTPDKPAAGAAPAPEAPALASDGDGLLAVLFDEGAGTPEPDAAHGIDHAAARELPSGVGLAPPVPVPVPDAEPPSSAPLSAGRKLLEPAQRNFSPDEMTIVHAADAGLGIANDEPTTIGRPDEAILARLRDPSQGSPIAAPAPLPAPEPPESEDALLAALEAGVAEAEEVGIEDLGPALEAEEPVAAAVPSVRPDAGPMSAPPRALPITIPPPWPDEREAAAHVLDSGAREAWLERLAFFEGEARAASDRGAKARGLLFAAEIAALTGDEARATALATEARELSPNHPLAHRLARSTALRDGDWATVVAALEAEGRTAPTPTARAHDALLAAEIARIATREDELAKKRLEQAVRALPHDPRAPLAKLAEAVGAGETLPKIRWPEGPELAVLTAGATQLARWRGATEKGAVPDSTPVGALHRARRALAEHDRSAMIDALESLRFVRGVADGAAWLGAAIAAPAAATRPRAAELLARLADGAHGPLARRARAARAVELGDPSGAQSALADPTDAFTAADRLALGALAGADADAVRGFMQQGDDPAGMRALSAAVGVALAEPKIGEAARAVITAGAPGPAAEMRLGRLLAARADEAQLREALDALVQTTPRAPVVSAIAAEIDLDGGKLDAVASAIAAQAQSGAAGDGARDRLLAAGALFELASAREQARDQYDQARAVDPTSEAAARAALATGGDAARKLLEHEAAIEDPPRAALLLLEAALRQSELADPEGHAALLRRIHNKAPELPFAAWLAERAARGRGDFDGLIGWLRDRREASDDAVEIAHDLVREALLVADRDLAAAAQLLEQASGARPKDVALRELYERLAPEPPTDRAAWRTQRALEATGETRGRMSLEAALECERAGDAAEAAKLARMAEQAGDHGLAPLTAERNEIASGGAADLAERLMNEARTSEDPVARREAYERLAVLDRARDDAASASMWHRSILEESPAWLPSLSELERLLIGEGREDELEPILTEIAKAATGSEATSHAAAGARLRMRAGSWDSTRDLVEIAFAQAEPSLWSLRQMDGHARQAGDLEKALLAAKRLAEKTMRPLELSTLTLRAAEAASGLGDDAQVRELLTRAVELEPNHPVAQRMLADLAERVGDFRRAAESWEQLGDLSGVPEHQLEARHRAAVLWLDKVGEPAKGRAALESAAEIDVAHADIFPRLRDIFVAAGDRMALATLLERRLEKVTDAAERVELEITRGRALAEVGDADAAKRALAAALESNPDHVEALAAFADVCTTEEDWTGTEQALIRLARLVPGAGEQAAIYMRLGALYDDKQPNPERAELAYLEVLKRNPGDVPAEEKLVEIYSHAGDGPKALQFQQALVSAATGPAEKRRRIVDLARIHEEVAHDLRKAETTLEAARKEFPTDVAVLSALAEFFKRNKQGPALTVLLDRAAGDSRRALSTGRFDPNLFATLGAVAKLRDRADAARVAETTLAAIEGHSVELAGVGVGAADAKLDDTLAPDVLTPAFRALLRKSGEVLDHAVPLDLKSMRAAPLPQQMAGLSNEIKQLGAAFGLNNLEVYVSPAIGQVCMPVGSFPAQIVLGAPLAAAPEDGVRRFLVLRALKVLQAKASAFSRTAPIDLWPLAAAYLKAFAPDWQPQGVDAGKVADAHARIMRSMPKRLDDDVGVLALEVIGSIGNKASTLNVAVNGWGDRVALLATGDPMAALTAVSWASGHSGGPPPGGPERVTWIGRNAEARDLIVFSVSDAYAEARAKLGAR